MNTLIFIGGLGAGAMFTMLIGIWAIGVSLRGIGTSNDTRFTLQREAGERTEKLMRERNQLDLAKVQALNDMAMFFGKNVQMIPTRLADASSEIASKLKALSEDSSTNAAITIQGIIERSLRGGV